MFLNLLLILFLFTALPIFFFVTKLIFSLFLSLFNNFPKKIYINRKDSASLVRHILNEDEIEQNLKNNGFTLINATSDKNNDDIFVFDGSEGKIKILTKYSRNNLASVVTVKDKSIIEKVIINQYTQIDSYRFPSEFFKLSFQNNTESKQWVTISDYKHILKSERLDLLYKLL